MVRFGKAVVKNRVAILIVCVLLLIPSIYGMMHTRINYDMLTYLPDELETVIGQDILMERFGKGGFSMVVVEGMEDSDISVLKTRMEQIPHVESVLWADSLINAGVPLEILPDGISEVFYRPDATMLAVFFDTSTSADETMEAVEAIRNLAKEQVFVSGMSAMVTDLKNLCEREEPHYVGLAVLLAVIATMLTLDNFLAPLLFLLGIGMTILYNLGTNMFLGEISYITKALAAVLQLAVTMDYSIFLWHSYEEKCATFEDPNEAMAHAIAATLESVTGSSITTIAGFIALCFMSYTMGLDLGLVMAKGVLLGVIGSVTLLPALILWLRKPLKKATHRSILPRMNGVAAFAVKHAVPLLVVFLLVLLPAVYGYHHTGVYYNLGEKFTVEGGIDAQDVPYSIANDKLEETFGMANTHIILCDAQMREEDMQQMMDGIRTLDGVQSVLGLGSVTGRIPREMLPEVLVEQLSDDKYQMLMVNSSFAVSTPEMDEQIERIKELIKRADPEAMLIGEAPCTKDLIEVTDRDFNVVNAISIVAVFVIILLVLRSAILPVILVAVIELAIYINLGIPYYTGTTLPFIAPICITTIQLGATVDYAILLTTRYKQERMAALEKHTAAVRALSASIPSILVSALGFFAATFGVALYSNVDIIRSMCALMARGALVSMVSVVFLLPALLVLFDRVICATTKGMRGLQSKGGTSL